jgi:ketol-acid reductoisomerase
MKRILAEIQSGAFAREWLAECRAGGPNFQKMRLADRNHPVEIVGAKLRAMMPWLDAPKVPEQSAPAAAPKREAAPAR